HESDCTPFFGVDVTALAAGTPGVIDATTLGYPLASLKEIPAGDYYVQGLLNVYSELHRADGHTLWLHDDQWEGQQFNKSPGNLVSEVRKVHLDPGRPDTLRLELTRTLPPVELPPDTKWVKHIKIQSEILTAWWGRPMYLGATVLLPRGYETDTARRDPAGAHSLPGGALPHDPGAVGAGAHRRIHRRLGSARPAGVPSGVLRGNVGAVSRPGRLPELRDPRHLRRHQRLRPSRRRVDELRRAGRAGSHGATAHQRAAGEPVRSGARQPRALGRAVRHLGGDLRPRRPRRLSRGAVESRD